MKYIRTKDEIYEVDTLSIHYIGETHFCCWDIKHTRAFNEWHIIKQADTVEELCDEFVIVWKDYKYKHCLWEDLEELRLSYKDYQFDEMENIFGAIWTDEGLIYKAKMKGILPNGEIDWELL